MTSVVQGGTAAPAAALPKPGVPWWKMLAPIVAALAIALVPAPEGLPQHAWYFFAIFVGVIVGLMLEPLPGAAIGLIGVSLVTVLSPYVLFGADQLAKRASSRPTRRSPGRCRASRTPWCG
jgi:di/tricarboxylate transporter